MSSSNGFRFGLVLVMAAVTYHGATAQSGGCTSALISLTPCLSYVSGNASTPSSSCCSQLASVVSSQPQCLCQLVGGSGGSSLGITINQTRALELPDACSVTTPSVSRCNGGNSPSDSPGAGGNAPSDSPGAAGGNPPADSSDDNQGTPAGTPPPGTPSNDDGGSANTSGGSANTSGGSANTSGGSANTSGASFVGMQLHDVRLFLVLVASCALSSLGHY
ncbi:Non-specific lipid transfer protein GPI-anchored 5 [Linum perenne]